MPPTIETQSPISFEEDLTAAFQSLRGSLERLVGSTGVDAREPQELARRLGVNRNLTWKISKVLGIPDLYQALQHLPGDEGLEIFVKAARAAGASDALAENVRAAQRAFARVVEIHAGDRGTLDLMLESMSGAASTERLENSRKLAFRGNSAVWGIQARVRFTTSFLAPNAEDPSMLDSALVGGITDLRRLRAGVRWPLFRPRWYNDDGSPRANSPREEAIDPALAHSDGPKLITDFCTPTIPSIRLVKNQMGWVYELDEAPIGNAGAVTCCFGTFSRRAVPRYRTDSDRFGELGTHVYMPFESLQFDLIVHRDLAYMLKAEARVRAQLEGQDPGPNHLELPVVEGITELTGQPPVLASPKIPRYEELMQRVFDRVGWDRRHFRGIRLTIAYPTMHSMTVLRFPLPERP